MKRLISLFLILLLCCACSVSVFADVWLPPIDDGGYCEALENLPGTEGEEILNRIASSLVCKRWAEEDVFANCDWGSYLGDREYLFLFSVYQTTADPETCYALEDPRSAENALLIGRFNLQIKYEGDIEATTFADSDLTPLDCQITKYSEAEIARANHITAQSATTAEVAAVLVTEAAAETDSKANGSFWTAGTILLVIGVSAAAIAAAAAILLVKKKQR